MKNKKIYFVLILFLLAIMINTLSHFFHPSYRYYRDNIDKLKTEFVSFKDQVVFEIVPSINTVNTNLTFNILTQYESNLVIRINDILKKSQFKNESKNENLTILDDFQVKEIYVDDYQYSEVNNTKYVRLYGDNFRIGDILLGEVIVSIDPLITRTLHYHFLNKKVQQERRFQ